MAAKKPAPKLTAEEKLTKKFLQRLDNFDTKLLRVQEAINQLDKTIENMQADIADYRGVGELEPHFLTPKKVKK